jgi:ATP sulfurylase
LQLEEIYKYDLNRIAKEIYGTLDDRHPGVRALKQRGEYFLGGKIELIKRLPSEHKHYELTPKQSRMIFESRGWSKVIGFHTRNVSHRAHEHIQLSAVEKYHCDGLFFHRIVGP